MPGTKKSNKIGWATRREKESTRATQEVSGPDINGLSIDELIGLISSPMSEEIDLPCVHRAIELAKSIDGIPRQNDVLSACMRKLLRGKSPKEQQVRSLRRLVFGLGDTLLIAKTGFGKSIIFHAYSILTGKITIQLVPLSKLGEEQAEDINKYQVTGTNACLVSHETKRKHANLAREIRLGKYTHILTSPEQTAMDWFLELVLDVDFRDRIGLVAIDECHLVSTWATFRDAYAKLFTLRASLLPSVAWFGCTATLTKEQEAEVLRFGGFRKEGLEMGELEIIRTSVDRPDISLHFLPIPPRTHTSLQCLYPLLDEAARDVIRTTPPLDNGGRVSNVDGLAFSGTEASDTEASDTEASDTEASDANDPSGTTQSMTVMDLTPQSIPKTILFVDGRTKVASVAQALIDKLVLVGYSSPLAFRTVETFHSFTSDHEKDRIFNEFRKSHSHIRILVATTAVGLGMNLPDVERVVVYGLLITMDLSDLMQRIGRAARAHGRVGDALIFLPYWLFSDYGEDKPGQTPLPARKRKERQKRRNRNKPIHGKGAGGSKAGPSGQGSDPSQAPLSLSRGLGHTNDQGKNNDEPMQSSGRWCEKRKYWTKEELEKRAGVSTAWLEVVNAGCHRQVLMKHFREDEADGHTKEDSLHRCCNGSACEEKMTTYDSWPLQKQSSVVSDSRKPRSGTVAAIALERIEKWCLEHADDLVGPEFMGEAPAWLVLSDSVQIKAAKLFRLPRGQKTSEYRPVNSVDDLRKVISLSDWGRSVKYEQEFVDFLIQEFPAVQEEHAAARAKSKAMKNAEASTVTLDATDADNLTELTELGAELARDPGNRRIRDRLDNQQSMMVTMFRRRHEQTVRLSSGIMPSVQANRSFAPTVQSSLRVTVPVDSYDNNATAVGDTSACEDTDGVEKAAGMCDCMIRRFSILCVLTTIYVEVTPVTPDRGGKKRAVESPPSIGRAWPARRVCNSSPDTSDDEVRPVFRDWSESPRRDGRPRRPRNLTSRGKESGLFDI